VTNKKTVKEQLIEMQAVQETRNTFVDEERGQVKKDIKQLTFDVSKIESNIVGVNTEVNHLKETVDEVKIDVKDGFQSLEDKMDSHFSSNGRNSKIKRGAIIAGVPTLIASLSAGLWQLGLRVGWWV
tara:strand:- start:242 stop:622 length:381 start_codon:yes stop_codon:yes gene_type:complete